MDFINPESAGICRKKAGMKKTNATTLFILTKSKKS
jgi:hypothetical protein